MNPLIKKYVGSILRAALQALAGFLLAHGAITAEQQGIFSDPALIDVGASVVIWGITLLLSLMQKRAQEQLFQTALVAHPKTPKEDVVNLVKNKLGVKVGWLGVLMILLLPATINAQTLNVSAVVHDYVQNTPIPVQAAPPSQTIIKGVEDKTVLRTAQGIYLAGIGSDAWAACNAVRQKDTKGNTINTPSNALVPSECGTILAEKVGVGVAALIASEKLWPDHKFESISTLVATGLAFFASAMTNKYEPKDVGVFPPPATSGARFALKVGF